MRQGDYISKGLAVERAESICRRIGKEIKRIDAARIINAKKPDGTPRYFHSVKCISPKLTAYYAIVDTGNFEKIFLAARKHYEANKPLRIRGRDISDEEIIDPGFDWERLDEEDE